MPRCRRPGGNGDELDSGLAGVAAFEQEAGELTPAERAEGEAWARQVAGKPAARPRARRRRSA